MPQAVSLVVALSLLTAAPVAVASQPAPAVASQPAPAAARPTQPPTRCGAPAAA